MKRVQRGSGRTPQVEGFFAEVASNRERKKMSGRPVHLLTAAIAAAASLLSASAASAGCYSGCGGYAAPVAYYSAPVVYSYSYAAPVTYAAPCSPCGSYGHASPMYVVNQGPTYAAPVIGEAEGVYDTGYRRSYPYYADGGVRWHRRHHWRHHGYGYRHHGYRHRGYGYRDYGYRSRMFAPGYRHGWRPRHPMVGPGGMWRGPRHAGGMHMMRTPGVVHPRHMGGPMGGPRHMGGHPMMGGPKKKMP
jgi:hypothetical protein